MVRPSLTAMAAFLVLASPALAPACDAPGESITPTDTEVGDVNADAATDADSATNADAATNADVSDAQPELDAAEPDAVTADTAPVMDIANPADTTPPLDTGDTSTADNDARLCANACERVGVVTCDPGGKVVTCGDLDGDTCLEWGPPVACPATETCEEGVCKGTIVLINELVVDSPSSPDTDTFIELRGPPGTQLFGASLVAINGQGGGSYATINLSGTIAADGLFVIAHPSAKASILLTADLTDSKVDLQNGPDSLQLRFGSTVVDAVAYGTFDPGEHVFAGEGNAAPKPGIDQALTRDDAGTDTNNNAVDFRLVEVATPGALGVVTPGCENAPCSIVGAKSCVNGARATCSDSDNDGCLDLGAVTSCGSQEVCEAGACVASCPNAKRVFVTEKHYNGDLAAAAGVTDGLAGGDALCNMAAAAVGLAGTFKAWLSTDTVDAIDRLADVGPWYLVGGCEQVFANKNAIVTGYPQVAITRGETGATVIRYYANAWTGTLDTGRGAFHNCDNWTRGYWPDWRGEVGLVESRGEWTSEGYPGCDLQARIYCFEQ